MFGILLSNVLAATGGGELPGLGPYPILQLFGGIISLIALGAAALVYRKVPNGEAPVAKPAPAAAAPADAAASETEGGVHLYFGGPLKDISTKLDKLDALKDQIAALAEAVSKNKALHYESREMFASALRETRHDIKNALHADVVEQSGEINDAKRLISDLRDIVVRLDEYVRQWRPR